MAARSRLRVGLLAALLALRAATSAAVEEVEPPRELPFLADAPAELGDDFSAPPVVDPAHPLPAAGQGCACRGCRSGTAPTASPPAGYPGILGEPWGRRPFYADLFAGVLTGDDLIDGEVTRGPSFLGGFRLGADLDEAWGVETRFGWSDLDLANADGTGRRSGDLFLWDVGLVRYLGGTSRVRPFLLVGVGVVDLEFLDAAGEPFERMTTAVPVGIGVKQRLEDWMALRIDVTDTISFGGGPELGTQHHFGVTGSVEFRFGGPRTSYDFWRPARFFW